MVSAKRKALPGAWSGERSWAWRGGRKFCSGQGPQGFGPCLRGWWASILEQIALATGSKSFYMLTTYFNSHGLSRGLAARIYSLYYTTLLFQVRAHWLFTVVKKLSWASLVAQWSRIYLPMRETQVRSLVWEDPTCCRATKLVGHSYLACALEPGNCSYWAHGPQLLKAVHPKAHAQQQETPLQWEASTRRKSDFASPQLEKSPCSNEDPAQPKIGKKKVIYF